MVILTLEKANELNGEIQYFNEIIDKIVSDINPIIRLSVENSSWQIEDIRLKDDIIDLLYRHRDNLKAEFKEL